jgi:sec-independent protein translocase protein TatB
MFNIGGGELLVIVLVALIVLGPQRLPDAIRTLGRVLSEVRRLSTGFQQELRDALEEETEPDDAAADRSPERREAVPLAAAVADVTTDDPTADDPAPADPAAGEDGSGRGPGEVDAPADDRPSVPPVIAEALDTIERDDDAGEPPRHGPDGSGDGAGPSEPSRERPAERGDERAAS